MSNITHVDFNKSNPPVQNTVKDIASTENVFVPFFSKLSGFYGVISKSIVVDGVEAMVVRGILGPDICMALKVLSQFTKGDNYPTYGDHVVFNKKDDGEYHPSLVYTPNELLTVPRNEVSLGPFTPFLRPFFGLTGEIVQIIKKGDVEFVYVRGIAGDYARISLDTLKNIIKPSNKITVGDLVIFGYNEQKVLSLVELRRVDCFSTSVL